MKVKIEEIKELCVSILMKYGLNRDDSILVVDEFIERELMGEQGHGFNAFIEFGPKRVKSRKGDFVIVKDEENYLLVNGNGNLGQVVCNSVVPSCIKKAKKHGISMMGIYNMESYLTPGTYARLAAVEDIIAMIFNYGGTKRTAPTGSIDPIFGTNPIAIGIPANEFPIVLDMATSTYAMMKVRRALKLKTDLPVGGAIDKNGNPTIDPKEIMDGALLPFGDHKGYGLALTVEILSRCMLDVHKKDGIVNRGYFFIFIDPTKFIEISAFKDNVEELKQKIKNSRKAKGTTEILLPGERSNREKKESLNKGYIEIDDTTFKELKSLT